MARAALGISRDELATRAQISTSTVVRFEGGAVVSQDSVIAMKGALLLGGVEFISAGAIVKDSNGSGGVGVRLQG